MKNKIQKNLKNTRAVIKVIGVGGAGGNAVNRLPDLGLQGVELIVVDSDTKYLRRSKAEVRIQIGKALTKGLSAGGDPAKGRDATEVSEASLKATLAGADIVFVAAGMGGGTGTGGAPVVARLAKATGALTIGVVTWPFRFEGRMHAEVAESGIAELRGIVDSLLVIPNDRLFAVVDTKTSSEEAFRRADDVLRTAVQSISYMIAEQGTWASELNNLRAIIKNTGKALIDLGKDAAIDAPSAEMFRGLLRGTIAALGKAMQALRTIQEDPVIIGLNDLRAIMKDAGEALFGIGEASGSGRALRAVQEAINSPLLANSNITGAKNVLVKVTGSKEIMTSSEMDDVIGHIQSQVSTEARVKVGRVCDESMGDSIRVTVIVTGFPSRAWQAPKADPKADPTDWWTPAFRRFKLRRLKLPGGQ
jgi:cell division protein FtsZ